VYQAVQMGSETGGSDRRDSDVKVGEDGLVVLNVEMKLVRSSVV